MTVHETREAWLDAAVLEMRPIFTQIDRVVPPLVRVSTGWSKGAKKSSVGWCWKSEVASDAASNIFISPELVDPVIILAVLMHELAHATNDCRDGHGGDFLKMHARLGFVGKPTASMTSAALFDQLSPIADRLGEYPHAKLTPDLQIKKQTTRMLKLCAPDCCQYIARVSKKWVDTGLPFCPCGTQMQIEDEGR